jgi:hypothetical protein
VSKAERWWEPTGVRLDPVKVEGLLIQSGEQVIVHTEDGPFSMTYRGSSTALIGGLKLVYTYWMDFEPGTAPQTTPGPYTHSQLRHPGILDKIIHEIDADE